MIENIQKYPIRFIQYAALVGSLYCLAEGNFILAAGLFAMAISIETMLSKLCFLDKSNPETIRCSFALSDDGFSYPSQLGLLFSEGALTAMKAIKSNFVQNKKDNEKDIEEARPSPSNS